uniref:Uncharacterized protein n=1 Tax=Romanomermis culicivorax TaxID=13658 RepID=A0A915KD10_ROMCU
MGGCAGSALPPNYLLVQSKTKTNDRQRLTFEIINFKKLESRRVKERTFTVSSRRANKSKTSIEALTWPVKEESPLEKKRLKNNSIPPIISGNESNIVEDLPKADLFNDYFAS